MLRAQEDINRLSTTTLLSESDGTSSYQRGKTPRGGFGRGGTSMKTRFIFFLSEGNVMILDAVNQKQVINRYAKLDSSGFFRREKKRSASKMSFFSSSSSSQRKLLSWKKQTGGGGRKFLLVKAK